MTRDVMEPINLTPEEVTALDMDLAEVKAKQAGWGQFEQRVMKAVPRLFRAYKTLLADADTYVFNEGKAAGRKEAVDWLRVRAAKIEAEVNGDCDGQDADRLCNEASLLYSAANDFARGSEP